MLNMKATVSFWKADITNLARKAVLNTKVPEGENRIPGITNLVTKAAFNTKDTEIENKIPDTTNFITSPEFNRLAKISFDEKL